MKKQRHRNRTHGARGRVESLDIYRGFAIVAVVLIHVLGHFLPVAPESSGAWAVMAFVNRALQFAVPAFLFISAFLNMWSLLRGRPLAAWAGRRIQRALWPYVLWSLVFLVIARWGRLETLNLAFVSERLATGNAYYHLYFLLLIVQMYVLLPLVAPIFRKRPPFWAVALVTLVLQGAVYYANRRWLFVSQPGSVILWYLPSVSLGCWLATQRHRPANFVRRGQGLAVAFAAVMLVIHVPQALRFLRDQPLNTMLYQVSLSLYAAAASFGLLALSTSRRVDFAAKPLRVLGARSLEVYITHPIAILLLDAWLDFPPRIPLGAVIPVYAVACLVLPLAFAWLISRLGLARWVWGVEAA